MHPRLRLALLPSAAALLALLVAASFTTPPTVATDGAVVPQATYIRLDREPGGDIDAGGPAAWDGVYENSNGAMVWNGTEWVINTTWAHTYFTDRRTGERLVPHVVAGSFDGSGAPNETVVKGYTVTQAIYGYSVPATAGGDFGYEAVEYRIAQPDGKRLIVRSRGCGLGIEQAHLDVYIEDPYAGVHVAALRGDPVMYVYDGSLEQAILITNTVQGAYALLPTFAPEARARYWLDVNNGSDVGGYSYVLRTQALDCQTDNLGSAFVSEFQLQYYESTSNALQELRFLPRLLSETAPATATPTATATASRTPMPTATPTTVPVRPVYLPLILSNRRAAAALTRHDRPEGFSATPGVFKIGGSHE
jgi:hypothetical protein